MNEYESNILTEIRDLLIEISGKLDQRQPRSEPVFPPPYVQYPAIPSPLQTPVYFCTGCGQQVNLGHFCGGGWGGTPITCQQPGDPKIL